MNITTDNPKCEICGGRTALISGPFYYEQDSEPYIAGVEEEAESGSGECEVSGFICDGCSSIQGLFTPPSDGASNKNK